MGFRGVPRSVGDRRVVTEYGKARVVTEYGKARVTGGLTGPAPREHVNSLSL